MNRNEKKSSIKINRKSDICGGKVLLFIVRAMVDIHAHIHTRAERTERTKKGHLFWLSAEEIDRSFLCPQFRAFLFFRLQFVQISFNHRVAHTSFVMNVIVKHKTKDDQTRVRLKSQEKKLNCFFFSLFSFSFRRNVV